MVFLDTVGLIALWDRRDQWHQAAQSALAKCDQTSIRFVLSTYVFLECANHAARKPYRSEVIRLREELIHSGDLFEPSTDEIVDAWNHYSRFTLGNAAVIDLVSFAIMSRLEIKEAFTNDQHFKAAGFETQV